MFDPIKKSVKRFWQRYIRKIQEPRLPKVAPSVAEAILPLETETYILTPTQLKQMMETDADFVLLDIREEWEYRTVHLAEATWIPYAELPNRYTEIPPDVEVIVYCHWGMRSFDAAFLLQQLGFKSVKSLRGGIDRWAREIDPALPRY